MLTIILPLVLIMLWLLLSIEGERYALESNNVIEVLPWAKLQTLHQAPPIVAGLLNYRDRSIPIMDLSQILYGRTSRLHICTRIILMQRESEVVGFLAEQVSRTHRLDNSHPGQIPAPVSSTPLVTTILPEPQGVVQCLEMAALWTVTQPALQSIG
jgi:chemotaxis-related protein WspB